MLPGRGTKNAFRTLAEVSWKPAKTIPVTVHADDDRVLEPQLEYAEG